MEDKRGKEAQPLPCIDDFTPEELLEMLKESEREIRAGGWYSVDGAVRAMRKKIREAAKTGSRRRTKSAVRESKFSWGLRVQA